MVAANKFDLLPTQATARRVEQWVRLRLRQAGLPRPDSVFMVSALSGFGVREMLGRLRDEMGFRADLWVVGAQNAGKSSLINAMKRAGGTGGRGEPTVAPVPGTTLGLLRVPGLPLGPKQRVFDTPGVRHGYQLTTRLGLEDVSMVLPRRRLKPRTWRLGAGSTVLIGGLARVDVLEAPAQTIYLTVFVSDDVTCHMGRSDGAEERREKHAGAALVPPGGPGGLAALGPLVPREAVVSGGAWDRSSADVAIAGLGWVGVGVKGEAKLRVWAPDGVAVTVHDALVPDYAKDFQRPGWSDLLPAKSRGRLAEAAKEARDAREAAAEGGEEAGGEGRGEGAAGEPQEERRRRGGGEEGGGGGGARRDGAGAHGGGRGGGRGGGGGRGRVGSRGGAGRGGSGGRGAQRSAAGSR
ncbi:MAG: hypothetical protein J3K34DRAFT_383481 [Monoraphidium minutum]|nr:MAG: hypothetical protein J3K34DRAFT_383481 [Monoraphidium minutum]